MVVFSFKMTKAKISLALFCAVAILITSTAIADSVSRNSETKKASVGITNEDRVNFLTANGWEIIANPIEIKDVVIPNEFDAVYTEYNNLQKKFGMDLSNYKGKTVKQYSYEIMNHPNAESGLIVANILVYNGKIIGGDICNVKSNGFMHGLTDIDTIKSALNALSSVVG